ncbi:MAG TPA: hypothetical protein VLI92_02040, partial [Candidatus Saccharimonadales bacterium]|nr:hypothetical protein [Candidatus Saccharimonadales bacterium]
ELSVKKSLLREDLLNTIVTDPDNYFPNEIELSILDAYFRFGIIEVGYSANWVVNPNADKPILRSDSRPYVDAQNNIIKQPKEIPESEKIYIKRIPASTFRVGGLESSELTRCNWCGYYEYVRVEDFKANKKLKNLDLLNWSGARSDDFVRETYGPEVDTLVASGDLLKIWKIWDLRAHKFYIFSDLQSLTHLEEKFVRLPLFDLRPNRLTKGWYPLPPVRNWKPAQDEINDSHEQMRNHRKRFTRKYVYNGSAFPDEEEMDKLINGGDGTFVKTSAGDVRTVCAPVENADLGAQEGQSLVVTQNDLNIISGTSSESRSGTPDKTSATQAQIINQRAQIRDSRQRIQVAKWLARIGREILLLAEEKFTLPVWVKMQIPVGEIGDNLSDYSFLWHQITMNDLKGSVDEEDHDFDFDVSIELDSMSPISNDDEKNKFLLFLSSLTQFPELSESPLLVRELAYKIGYRNEKVIQQLQKIAQTKLQIQLAQLGIPTPAQGNGPVQQPGQMAQGMVAQQTPPNNEQVRQQLQNQIVTTPTQ